MATEGFTLRPYALCNVERQLLPGMYRYQVVDSISSFGCITMVIYLVVYHTDMSTPGLVRFPDLCI